MIQRVWSQKYFARFARSPLNIKIVSTGLTMHITMNITPWVDVQNSSTFSSLAVQDELLLQKLLRMELKRYCSPRLNLDFSFFLVPCLPPNVTSIFDTTGKSIRIIWDAVLPHCQNGIILGYYIYSRKLNVVKVIGETESSDAPESFGEFKLNVTTIWPAPLTIELKELGLRTNYSFIVAAYTSKGPGVNSSLYYMATGDFSKYSYS